MGRPHLRDLDPASQEIIAAIQDIYSNSEYNSGGFLLKSPKTLDATMKQIYPAVMDVYQYDKPIINWFTIDDTVFKDGTGSSTITKRSDGFAIVGLSTGYKTMSLRVKEGMILTIIGSKSTDTTFEVIDNNSTTIFTTTDGNFKQKLTIAAGVTTLTIRVHFKIETAEWKLGIFEGDVNPLGSTRQRGLVLATQQIISFKNKNLNISEIWDMNKIAISDSGLLSSIDPVSFDPATLGNLYITKDRYITCVGETNLYYKFYNDPAVSKTVKIFFYDNTGKFISASETSDVVNDVHTIAIPDGASYFIPYLLVPRVIGDQTPIKQKMMMSFIEIETDEEYVKGEATISNIENLLPGDIYDRAMGVITRNSVAIPLWDKRVSIVSVLQNGSIYQCKLGLTMSDISAQSSFTDVMVLTTETTTMTNPVIIPTAYNMTHIMIDLPAEALNDFSGTPDEKMALYIQLLKLKFEHNDALCGYIVIKTSTPKIEHVGQVTRFTGNGIHTSYRPRKVFKVVADLQNKTGWNDYIPLGKKIDNENVIKIEGNDRELLPNNVSSPDGETYSIAKSTEFNEGGNSVYIEYKPRVPMVELSNSVIYPYNAGTALDGIVSAHAEPITLADKISNKDILDYIFKFKKSFTDELMILKDRESLAMKRSNKDENGIWTTVEFLDSNDVVQIKTVLSEGESPKYTKMTKTIRYGNTTIDVIYQLIYDADDELIETRDVTP